MVVQHMFSVLAWEMTCRVYKLDGASQRHLISSVETRGSNTVKLCHHVYVDSRSARNYDQGSMVNS